MDKYEYKVRSDEIKSLIAEGNYTQAAEIADTIDWRRVKSVMMLCTVSDLYKINRRYEDAKNMLLLAYERRPGGRTICYSLCELCIKTEEFMQALKYYKEFVQVAPRDTGRYILQYKLYEAQEVSLEERIGVLEELKKRDYREKWAYELAYLYHRVGLGTRCVEECDELILWFGDGKYVVKAMELKMLHQPLTAAQQEVYDRRFEEEPSQDGQEPDGHESYGEEDDYGQLTEGQPDYGWGSEEEPPEEDGQEPAHLERADSAQGQPEELDIQVKTMDVGQYNTINLQAELAAGLQEVLGTDGMPQGELAAADQYRAEAPEDAGYPNCGEEEIEDSEVFFGATGELEDASLELETAYGDEEDAPERQEEDRTGPEPDDADGQRSQVPEPAQEIPQEPKEGNPESRASQTSPEPESAGVSGGQTGGQGTENGEENSSDVQPPRELADVLSQEADGQISIVMPDNAAIEKQITGQMKLDDILVEWERIKKENEAKCQEEVRRHVLSQTGPMFTEFDAAVRDGLLEQLEKGDTQPPDLREQEAAAGTGLEELPEDWLEEPAETAEEDAWSEELAEPEEEDAWPEEPTEPEEEDAWPEELPETAEEDVLWPEELAEPEEEDAWPEELPETAEEDVLWPEELAEPEEEDAWPEELAEPEEEDAWPEEFAELEEDEAELPENDAADGAYDIMDGDQDEAQPGEEPLYLAEDGFDDEEEYIEETEDPEETGFGGETQHRENASPVEQERARVRGLTREEKELFAPFIQNRRSREQLVKALDSISMAAYTGNLVITGEEGMDTLTLAKNMMREIRMVDSNFSGKVAKVSGQGLNEKNLAETLEQLNNGALIVQKASGMNHKTAAMLHKQLQHERFGIIVVLEDTEKAMKKLFLGTPDLYGDFTARIDLEALSNDTLVMFGKQYAREKEFSIDNLGVLALHTRIEELQTIDHVVTVMEVKQIVDEAIRRASRKTLGHFFDVLLARRYDDEDMVILTEKDFAA